MSCLWRRVSQLESQRKFGSGLLPDPNPSRFSAPPLLSRRLIVLRLANLTTGTSQRVAVPSPAGWNRSISPGGGGTVTRRLDWNRPESWMTIVSRDVKKAETLLLLTKGIFVLTGCMFLSIHRLPPIGRPMVLKEDKKTVKAHVAMVSVSRS